MKSSMSRPAAMAAGCAPLSSILLLLVFAGLAPGGEVIPVWPLGAPGSEAFAQQPETVKEGPGVCNVSNVHNPSLTVYLPTAEKATGTAIVVVPGGGHKVLCLGHEGTALAEWFAEQGIAAFVLKYRLAKAADSPYTVDDHALADVQRAIQIVRHRASEWQIQPDRIGVVGFSAGGELAALSAMRPLPGDATAADPVQRHSSRPDYQVLIYPGRSERFTVADGMPPVFIGLGDKDRDDVTRGMAELYLKYKSAGIPAELHIYAHAVHGFGYRQNGSGPGTDWQWQLLDWLGHSQLLPESATAAARQRRTAGP